MQIVERAKQMLLTPASEWQAVEKEATPPREVMTGYVVPLAILGGAVILAVMLVVGLPAFSAVSMAVMSIVTTLAACVVAALVTDGMATTFGGRSDRSQAFKLVAYAFTPMFVAALIPIPYVGQLLRLLALIYSVYLLYLGIPVLMKSPADKAVPYTLVIIVATFIAFWIATMVFGMLLITGSLFTDNPFRIV